VNLLLPHPVTMCATAVQQWRKCENLNGALLSAPRVIKRLATSAIHTDSIELFVYWTVEMLHCGLEASGALGWREGWKEVKLLNI